MIFYAAPHDVNENLGYLYERLGDRRVAVIKEISKIHEKVDFFQSVRSARRGASRRIRVGDGRRK